MLFVRLTTVERDLIVRSLSVLSEEYHAVSGAVSSILLSRQFEDDARLISSLSGRFAGLTEPADTVELLDNVKRLMAAGQKIEAIKYVRENRFMGLKEAKDFVENTAQ